MYQFYVVYANQGLTSYVEECIVLSYSLDVPGVFSAVKASGEVLIINLRHVLFISLVPIEEH